MNTNTRAKLWRTAVKALVLVGVASAAMAVQADMSTWTEYFVATNGNDAFTGTAATWAGGDSKVGPKKTIQAAVSLANGKGTIVTVAPGIYDKGGVAGGSTYPFSNRVYIAKGNVLLRSSGGRDVTHIVGARDTSPTSWNGLGTNAVRCVEGAGSSTVTIKGFTLRDGAAGYDWKEKRDTTIRGGGAKNITVVDCVISNCTAHRGAAGHSCRFIRSIITSNANANNGTWGNAGDACSYLNCLIVRNGGEGGIVAYPSKMVGCTVAVHPNASLVNGFNNSGPYHFANCVFLNNESSSLNTSVVQVESCVANNNAVMPYSDAATVTNAVNCQYRSSAGFSWRLMADAEAVGRGKGAYLKYFELPECEGGVYRDVNGNVIDPESESIDCGCFQGNHYPVEKSGSMIVFNSNNVRVRDFGDFGVNDWIMSARFPEMFALKSAVDTPAYSFYNSDSISYGSNFKGYYQHYPEEDGWARYVANPDCTATNYLNKISVRAELYVDPIKGDDANDGSKGHPFRTLQAANDAATNNYTLVHAAPGIYAEGGAQNTSGSLAFSNRLCVTRQHIGFVADTPHTAIIKGAPDPESGALGTNAMRCVAFNGGNPSYSYLRGFDLTGGYANDDATDNNFFYGSAVYGNGRYDVQVIDCVISNNCGCQNTVFAGTYRRSKFFGNQTKNSTTIRTARAYDCILADNNTNSLGYVAEVAGCTADTEQKGIGLGHGSSTAAYMNGSVIENCGSVKISKLSATPLACYFNAGLDPLHFADSAHHDYRLSAVSPAANLVTPDDFAAINRWWQHFGLDAYGAEPAFTEEGCFNAGASRAAPLPYVVVTAYDGLSLTGGVAGTNVIVDTAAVLTFDATAVKRPFDGFTLNGVIQHTGKTWNVNMADLYNGDILGLNLTSMWYVDVARADDSGDGFTRATAKRTLIGAATNAIAGEVIRVAPGVYAEGTMLANAKENTANRVVVGKNVTLESIEGREVTIIQGSSDTYAPDKYGNGTNAVRCAYLNSGAVIRGFTLTGGRTQYASAKETSVDYCGGGVYGSNQDNTFVTDCVIHGCSAHAGAAGHRVYFQDSIISNCTHSGGSGARAAIGRTCKFKNCLFDHIKDDDGVDMVTRIESCTFGANMTMPVLYQASGTGPHIINSVFLSKGKPFRIQGATTAVFTNCVFGPAVTYANVNTEYFTNGCIRATAEELVFADGYRPVVGANVCVDAALMAYCGTEEKDATGAQRQMNGVRDIGALEADWRPRYAADLGTRVTISSASPDIIETATRAVRLPATDTVTTLEGTLSGKSNKRHQLIVKVTGGATLHVWMGDEELATFTAAEGEQGIRFSPAALPTAIRFTCTGTEGYADVLALNREQGLALHFR